MDHPEDLDPMLLAIRERMAIFGWRPRHVRLYTTDSKWMSIDEFNRLKSLRVPADICTIPSNEKSKYLGRLVIEADRFRKLVNPSPAVSIDVNKEIDINAVMWHDVTLDPRMFLTECGTDDIYLPGDKYYRENIVDGTNGKYTNYSLLKDGIDYTPGANIYNYSITTEDPVPGKKYYKLVPQYEMVPYGHNRDYPIDQLFVKRLSTKYTAISTTGIFASEVDVSLQYYIGTSESEPDDTFREADIDNEDDFDTEDVIESGVVITAKKKFKPGLRYYTLDMPYVQYTPATELLVGNVDTVLYRSIPAKYELIEDVDNFDGDRYERTSVSGSEARIMREVYSTTDAMALRGFKYKGDDVFGQQKTMTLQLEDIIDIGLDRTNTLLPEIFNADKYGGRMFEYTVPNSSNPNQPTTIMVVINAASYDSIKGKSGVILGQKGSVAKELYIKNDNITDRNYYMLYLEEKDKCEALERRCAEYEEIIRQMSGGN